MAGGLSGSDAAPGPATLRLDKWLWFARIVKTRAIAKELAESGHVRINGQRVKSASRLVRIRDVLTIALPSRVRVLVVADVAERRGPAPEGAALYEDKTDASHAGEDED